MQMIDEFFDNIDVDLFDDINVDLNDNMSVHLECDVPECDKGPGGVKWKTTAVSEEYALKLLERHERLSHAQQNDGGHAVAGGAGGKSRLAKIPRPTVSGGCSQ